MGHLHFLRCIIFFKFEVNFECAESGVMLVASITRPLIVVIVYLLLWSLILSV